MQLPAVLSAVEAHEGVSRVWRVSQIQDLRLPVRVPAAACVSCYPVGVELLVPALVPVPVVVVEARRLWLLQELLVSISSLEVQVEVELGVVDSSSVLTVPVVSVPVVEEGVGVRGIRVSSRLLLVPLLPPLLYVRWTGVSVGYLSHLPLLQQAFVPGL